jgi:hypothetical protein
MYEINEACEGVVVVVVVVVVVINARWSEIFVKKVGWELATWDFFSHANQ